MRGAFDTNAFTWVEGTIGAYTAVTMQADYVIDIQADPVPGASRRESVTASVSAFETQVLRTVYANPALGPQHLRLEGSLSDVLANDSVEGLPYSQRLFAEAQGRQFLPIPEPAAPALMLGGLGVLGAWVRRRRGAA